MVRFFQHQIPAVDPQNSKDESEMTNNIGIDLTFHFFGFLTWSCFKTCLRVFDDCDNVGDYDDDDGGDNDDEYDDNDEDDDDGDDDSDEDDDGGGDLQGKVDGSKQSPLLPHMEN